jgi:L-glyceraldehyde 3-phosphate reductase
MSLVEKFVARPDRYDSMHYNRCGLSGLKLPGISLGLWHNFGGVDPVDRSRVLLRRAFDLGVTHFDLANNYGPPYGSAEETFGFLYKRDWQPYRDELIISTKAGYDMWPGPYGNWGSRKYLVSSLDQSLKRMGLEYVDIFYHHRPDPETPLEETMIALDHIVRSGTALSAGISNYGPMETGKAIKILRSLGTPLLIHQASYNMFDRWVEDGLLEVLSKEGVGCIVFSPLAQGLLTERYLKGIPEGSRASRRDSFLHAEEITPEILTQVRKLKVIAQKRRQSMAQMALSWVLRQQAVTSALIGASSIEQIDDCVAALKKTEFSFEELRAIDQILIGS